MKTIFSCVTDINSADASSALVQAADIIRGGGLVIFPTETVYGLGADATKEETAARIYAAKGRPADNPLIVHIAYPSDASTYAETPPLYDRLAKAFMPGPLTVILQAKDNVPRTVTAGLDTVAIRCPSHPVAHRLIELAGVPIAAPSANLSGKPSPTCAAHVKDDMDGRVDMILDGGACDIGLESTIVRIQSDGTLLLLRPGGITVAMLEKICPHIEIAEAVTGKLRDGEKVLSPGMKYRHYAPNAPVYLLSGTAEQRRDFLRTHAEGSALLCHDDEKDIFSPLFDRSALYLIGDSHDFGREAHLLYTCLREAEKRNYRAIYAPLPSKEGIGLALYNRLIRAAAYQIIDLNEKR